jgi:hypothetical protein
VEHAVLGPAVHRRRPPRLGSPRRIAVDETHNQLRRHEAAGDGLDIRRVPRPNPHGCHVFYDLGLVETGVVGAHPGIGIDQSGEQLLHALRRAFARRSRGLRPAGELLAYRQVDGCGLVVPAIGQHCRGPVEVLAAAGGQAGDLVGLHPGLPVGRLLARPGQVGFDLGGALGEHSPLGLADPR